MKLRFDKIQTIFAVFLVLSIFVGLSCISAANIDNNSCNSTFIENTAVSAEPLHVDANFSEITHSGAILDDNNDFTMSARYNAGTGYHWEISPETHGIDVISTKYVQDNPQHGLCGGSGTVYYTFHVNDDDYFVKIVLVSPSGNIVDEIDSNMIN